MKDCPVCHTGIQDNVLFCPSCGSALPKQEQSCSPDEQASAFQQEIQPQPESEQPDSAQTAVGEAPAAQPDAGDCELCQTQAPECSDAAAPEQQTPVEEPDKPKRRRLGWIAGLVAVLGVLAAGIWYLTGALSAGGEPTARQMNKVILTSDNYSLTNTEFSYYYWSEYFYFINTYGSYLSGTLDTTKPLDEQIYDGETNWQDYMVDQALNTVANTMALVQAAESEGFALDEEFTASMQSVLENFETYAVSGGFTKADGQADLGAYLQDSYGPGASMDSFQTYLHNSYLSAAYSDYLYQKPVFSDEQIEAYYDGQNYEQDFGVQKLDDPMRNARIITIQPEQDTQQAWDTAYEKCQSILTTWNSQGNLEQDFATLAITYSSDAATSANGGLLEGVYPGQYDGALNDWLFDPARKEGDVTVLKLDDAYQIVYLASISQQVYWKTVAESDLRFETCQNAILELVDRYQFQVNRGRIAIATPKKLYDEA